MQRRQEACRAVALGIASQDVRWELEVRGRDALEGGVRYPPPPGRQAYAQLLPP